MRIGVDARGLSRKNGAGIAVYLRSLVNYFSSIHDDVKFVLYSNHDFVLPEKLGLKFEKRIVPSKFGGTINVLFFLKKHLKRDNIDVFWGVEHCLPIRKPKQIKTVLTIHDLAIFKFKKIGTRLNAIYLKLMLKKLLKSADRIITVSQSTKNDVIEMFKINREKIFVTYCGIPDKETSISEDSQLDVFGGKNVVNFFLSLSTIEPRKNIDTAIRAFNKYKETDQENYYLVIVGKKGWRYSKTIELIEKSPFKDYIVLTGFVTNNQKKCLLSSAKALVFPSLYEGFGIPIIEAFQFGLPVITSNVSSMPEVGGEAAFYLDDPLDYYQLSRLLTIVSKLSVEQKKIIRQNQLIQLDKFDITRYGKTTYSRIKEWE